MESIKSINAKWDEFVTELVNGPMGPVHEDMSRDVLCNIFVKYGDRVLMDQLNLVIHDRDKIGLVGRNGAGKSTLLKIIANEISPDSGQVTRPTKSSIGFLHQEMDIYTQFLFYGLHNMNFLTYLRYVRM